MKRLILLFVTILAFSACSRQKTDIIWSDEFNYNGLPDRTKWGYDTGYIANNEKQYYTPARIENALVSNGNLMIIGRKEKMKGFAYTSARLITLGKFDFLYGRAEARMRLPAGKGIWPAFWMLGSDITTVGWPKCGEIDIMEHINNVPVLYGTAHWDNKGHVQSGGTTPCDVTQFHDYGLEWTPDSVRWLLDGKRYYAFSIKDSVNNTSPFHRPQHLLLNLAIGGDWPGDPDSTTVFPDTVFVDWVRVHKPVK
ncbi:MAG TPA: glycoside hydrolase family 16 protein [Bacteroidales bacterium]|nr:glycoside hydrolase family 16 protein [Bacteroidales bacterium]